MPSPLIRTLLQTKVLSLDRLHRFPVEPPPFIERGQSLDVLSLLKSAISVISPQVIRDAVGQSFKIANLPGFPADAVPQEAVYESELNSILRRWLPSFVLVLPQVNTGGNSRCDIILSPAPTNRILLELVASVRIDGVGGVVDHFECVPTLPSSFPLQLFSFF